MDRFTQKFARIVPELRALDQAELHRQTRTGLLRTIPVNGRGVDTYWHMGASPDSPILFEFHGGGMVLGFAAQNDALRQTVSLRTGLTVVGVDYCKAPEHPYPAAMEEIIALMEAVVRSSGQYGVRPSRLALMGFSGGATLAAAAAMKCNAAGRPVRIDGLLLHYPYLDGVTDPLDKGPADEALQPEIARAFGALYANGHDPADPYISPSLAGDELLRSLPPTVIVTAKRDPLSREGRAFAGRLERAGVPVSFREVPQVSHGYIEDYFNLPLYAVRGGEHSGPRYEALSQYACGALEDSCAALNGFLSGGGRG